ncbi:hypothetical protein [Arthrobacter sp. UYCu723]
MDIEKPEVREATDELINEGPFDWHEGVQMYKSNDGSIVDFSAATGRGWPCWEAARASRNTRFATIPPRGRMEHHGVPRATIHRSAQRLSLRGFVR